MVGKLFGIFNKRLGGLHEAAYLLAAFALLSQLMALIRDRLLAHEFGAGEILDIYYAAFRIPDLIYVSIASFVAVTVLIPFLFEKIETSREATEQFMNTVLSVFIVSIIVVCLFAFFAMPLLAHLVAPGFDDASTRMLVATSRILLLSPILLGISNLLGSVTQLYKKFFVFALGPVLYNIGIILGLIFLEPHFGLLGVVMGVIFGAFCHMAIQIPVVIKSGVNLRPNFHFFRIFQKEADREKESSTSATDIKRLLVTSLPRTISLSITQFVIFILISVASLLSVGAISVFMLAHNLQSVPLAIIGMSYSVAAFPALASFLSNGEREKFIGHMVVATRHILFWSLPATVLFIVLRAQIVRVIFGSGAFTWADTRLVAAALALFSISVSAQSLVLLYARGYYAAGNTRRPLAVNALSALVIILLAFLLVPLFQSVEVVRIFLEDLLRVSGLAGTAILMLPLAFTMGMVLNASLLIYYFNKDYPIDFSGIKKSFRQGIYGSLFMGMVAYTFLNFLDDIFNLDTFWGIFLQGAISGIIGIAGGVALLWILDNEEIKIVSRTLHRRFWRTKIIGASDEDLLD